MFFKSIFYGLKILTFWQVWITIIFCMTSHFIFVMLCGMIKGRDEIGARAATGCIFYMIGGAVVQAILMGLLIAFLLPILLGGTTATPISTILELLWPIAKVGVIAVIIVTILVFVPFIGSFLATSPGMQAFLQGVIIFRLFSGSMIEEVVHDFGVSGDIYPGFLESIGFLIIAGILVYGFTILFTLIAIPFEGTTFEETIIVIIAPVLGVLGGIIPLFMYCAHVQLSLMQLIGR